MPKPEIPPHPIIPATGPSQRPGFAAFGITQLQFGDGRCRVGAAGEGLGPQGAQGTVGSQNQGIHHAQSVNRRAKPWANMLL